MNRKATLPGSGQQYHSGTPLKFRTLLLSLLAIALMTAGCGRSSSPPPSNSPGSSWTPGPEAYGVGQRTNVPVTMADGTVLEADIHFPTDFATGQEAAGPFPVILTQTPYGKELAMLPANGSLLSSYNEYLIRRGYIQVITDVRGTGASQGEAALFGPLEGQDGAELVSWAAKLPHSSGSVGLYGNSFMGINQYFTAAAVGPGSPLKAIFPIDAANDFYRDGATAGGILAIETAALYLGLTTSLNLLNPVAEQIQGPTPDQLALLQDHVAGVQSYQLALATAMFSGGDELYDQDYWMARAPRNVLEKIVANGIPAFIVGGHYDAFQRGAPLNYSGLQNAWSGRSATLPMEPRQAVTGRYQLLLGPWYHTTYGSGIDLNAITLQWFDTWLKKQKTGIEQTDTPIHMNLLGTTQYVDASRYPYEQAKPTAWYLSANGGLATAPPADANGADTLLWSGLSDPCSRSTDIWSLGLLATVFQQLGLSNPCDANVLLPPIAPIELAYSTAPFTEDTVLAGPIDATLYATSTVTDTELIVTLDDVAPDGSAASITAGALLGSHRALDEALTWRAADGKPMLPYHLYTRAAQQPVTPGEVTRFDTEIFPTTALLVSGHRLRVRIATADVPHLLPVPMQLSHLAGGIYQVQRNVAAASFIELPLAPANAFRGTSISGLQ